LDAAGVRTAVGLASANLDTQLADLPTVAEFEARSIVSADYFVVGDYTAPLDAAGVRTAVGLASADLDTQLGTLSTHDADDVKTALGTGDWITTPVTTDAASRTASKADVSALATTAALATHDGKLDTAQADLDIITGADGVFIAVANQPAGWPANLAASAGQVIKATVDTVTNTHTPTMTVFQADTITEATADHYNGRIVIFTSGVLAGQATDITDYAAVGGIGQFTVTAMTEAPSNDDTFVIV